MKKHLIAVAVASALAAPVMAQNVSIGGNIDAGYVGINYKNKSGDDSKTTLYGVESGSSTSELKFSVSEDLGGGMKATGYVSTAIGSRTDTTAEFSSDVQSTLSARDAWVALSGGFGEVKLGKFTPAAETIGNSFVYATTNYIGHGLDTNLSTVTTIQTGTAGELAAYSFFTPYSVQAGTTQIELGRQGGNVQFTTPSMNGLQAVVGISKVNNSVTTAAANDNLTQENSASNFGLTYASGKMRVGYAIANATVDKSTTANTKSDAEVSVFGASYDFGVADVALAIAQSKTNSGSADIYKANMTNLSVKTPLMGNIAAKASVGKGTLEDITAARTYDMTAMQVGLDYALSKRTTLYGIYGNNNATNKAANVDNQVNGIAAGIRHSF